MIEIYRRDENGKDRLIRTFNNLDELVICVDESRLACFGYSPSDRTDATFLNFDNAISDIERWISRTHYRYVAYDNDRLVTPDRLVGLRRAYLDSIQLPRWWGWHRRRGAWGSFRRIRTLQERRENEFLDYDEDAREYGIKARARRRGHNLPDAWDDYPAHNERSWKFQSKRRRQWKDK